MFFFSVLVVIKSINLIRVGTMLTKTKSFAQISYKIYDSYADHSVILRIIRAGSDGHLNIYKILASINIYDVLLIVISLTVFELNRNFVKKEGYNQAFLFLIIVSMIGVFLLFLSAILTRSSEMMTFWAGIIYLLLAGAYIGIIISEYFRILCDK